MSEGKKYRIGLSIPEINRNLGIKLAEKSLSENLDKLDLKFKIVNPVEQILSSVKSVIGKPYKRGASVLNDSPDSFDCSSLVAWAAVEAGFSIPRVSIDQYVYSKRIKIDDLKIGDLIFSNTKEIVHTEGTYYSKILDREIKEEPIRTETLEYLPGTKVPEGIDHVGVYVGDNKVIHSSSKNGGVKVEDIHSSLSFENIIGYGRVVEDESPRFIIEIPDNRPDLRNKDIFIKEVEKTFGK
jgi:hypothetical protein